MVAVLVGMTGVHLVVKKVAWLVSYSALMSVDLLEWKMAEPSEYCWGETKDYQWVVLMELH